MQDVIQLSSVVAKDNHGHSYQVQLVRDYKYSKGEYTVRFVGAPSGWSVSSLSSFNPQRLAIDAGQEWYCENIQEVLSAVKKALANHGRMGSLQNDYANQISPEVFDKTPKTVFAAIAVSFIANHLAQDLHNVDLALLHEWEVLHNEGIVPQRPPKGLFRKAIAKGGVQS
jgi:hypothetical protein